MRRIAFTAAVAGMLALNGCALTPELVGRVQVEQAKIEAAIREGCAVANMAAAVAAPFAAAPMVAGVLVYVHAGCGTAEAVAALTTKAVHDPGTIAWVTQLAETLNNAVRAVRG